MNNLTFNLYDLLTKEEIKEFKNISKRLGLSSEDFTKSAIVAAIKNTTKCLKIIDNLEIELPPLTIFSKSLKMEDSA